MTVDFAKLDRAFNPKRVVVVGDKKDMNYMWLRGQSTFEGELFSVQIDPNEIGGIESLGVENHPSLMDVPGDIDLVIVAVPRAVAPYILDDCIRKGVAAAHFFTSGFAETDTEEGVKLQKLLAEKSKAANFNLIGPNCMGIFNPGVGLRQVANQYSGLSGPVGLISQSGTHAIAFAAEAHHQGLDISKSVSFGNGIAVDAADYLEYFGRDDKTEAIGMYLEGVRDGQRFLATLKDVAARKPVVIWKGGRTEEGGRAIASHTGSLAVPQAIWDDAMAQCGTINVSRMEELIDTLKAVLYLSPVYGPRTGIAGGTGGLSVAIADVFAEAGMRVPPLTSKSYDELASFFSLIGGGYRNPIDTGNVNRLQMERIMNILEGDDNIDNLVLLTAVGALSRSGDAMQKDINMLTEIRSRTAKPVAVILSHDIPEAWKEVREAIERLRDRGIPAFTTLERGARAMRNALDYHSRKESIPKGSSEGT